MSMWNSGRRVCMNLEVKDGLCGCWSEGGIKGLCERGLREAVQMWQ